MQKTLLLILLVFPLLLSANKQTNTDSLWSVWNDTTQADTNRLEAMNKIVWKRYLYFQPDSAFYFAQIAHALAKQKGQKKYEALALNI